MFHPGIGEGERDDENAPGIPREDTAGRTLKKIFRQQDRFAGVEEQSASASVLMHPLRLSIFIHLFENPCAHTRLIARDMERSLSAVNWNLARLLQSGYVESCGAGGRKAYWPAGMVEEGDVENVRLLGSGQSRRILKIAHEKNGRARQRDFTLSIGASQQDIGYWTGKLVSAGMLEKDGKGSQSTYSISPGFVRRARHYETRAKHFSERVFDCLKDDGLMPRGCRLRGSRLAVDIRLPTGRMRLHLECNPMASVRRYVR